MARGNIFFKDPGGLSNVPAREFLTNSGTSAILAGEPVTLTTQGTNRYVKLLTDASPTNSGEYFVGIAAKDATHTATVSGVVSVYLAIPGLIWRAKAKTAANADTQVEIDALNWKRVILDYDGTNFTVDTAATDSGVNGIIIVGGDPNGSYIDFMVNPHVTPFGSN